MTGLDRWNPRLSMGMALLAVLVWLPGCAATKQPHAAPLGKTVEGSGFLGDLYPQMQEGEGDQPLRVYRSPTFVDPAAFAQYTRILVEPAVLYGGPDSKLAKFSEQDRQHIADAINGQLYEKLSSDYEMVSESAPNTLRIQAAVVDAEESWGKVEALSYVPIPMTFGAKMVVVSLASLLTGKPPFTGELTVEAKLSDAETGEVLSAMMDRRVGVRQPIIGIFQSETYDSWADVDQAIRYFAERVRRTLCVRRGATHCVEPKA
jgi:hypothetical protein